MESRELFVFDEKLREEREYWLGRLAKSTDRAAWPAPRRDSSPEEQAIPLSVSPELQASLSRLTKGDPFLTGVAFMAAVKVSLARYAQHPRVITASPARAGAGRNLIAVVQEIRDDLTGRELLMALRQTLMDGYARERYPFQRLLHAMDQEQAPPFDVGVRLAAFHGEWPEDHQFLVSIELDPPAAGGGRLSGTLRYDGSRLSEASVKRFSGHVLRVLGAILANPEQQLGRLALLTPEEEILQLEWCGRTSTFASEHCVHQLFEARVGLAPDRDALVFEDRVLSYAELNARANRLARLLVERGVGPEVRVGICLERSPEMVAAVLAVLKAGGAFVPLDPTYPQRRLDFMVADASIEHLLTRSDLALRFAAAAPTQICLDREPLDDFSAADLPRRADAAGLAYVIYTSGSTGTPKGVAISHRGVCNLIEVQQQVFELAEESRFLQLAAFSFDASVFEIFVTLCAGAALVLPPAEKCIPGRELVEFLQAQRVTTVIFPPSSLAVLPQAALPDLQTLMVAGEACPPRLALQWSLGRRFINAYGPTEATVCATMGTIETMGAHAPEDPSVSIGRPIANARVYVLDRQMRPVPIGIPGELYLGGPGIARGYLGRPALTAERFVPDPFSDMPGVRLYRTGDLASHRPDGRIDYLGRADLQVKVRGHRVEPGEVEAALRSLPGVRDAAVVAIDDDGEGGASLGGFVVPGQGARLDAAGLRAALRERVPEFLVPDHLTILETLPHTPAGKVDRKQLAALKPAHGASQTPRTAPRTPVEIELASIWCQVLKLDRVHREDNFFELGGHSLLVTVAVSRIHAAFGVDLPLRVMFQAPTLAALATVIAAAIGPRAEAPQPDDLAFSPIAQVPRDEALELSFAQQRLWFLDQLEPGHAFYHIPIALRLEGSLDRESLRRSFETIVARHEALRTIFVTEAGCARQVILPPHAWLLPVTSLAEVPEAEREAEVRRLLATEAVTPFDLSRGPLLRTRLLQLGPTTSLLQITLHHIVSDGWSVGVLLDEVVALYSAFCRGETPELPALALQYADFAAWQRRWLSGDALAKELSYWQDRLAAMPTLELVPDHPRPPLQTWDGALLETTLSVALATGLDSLGQSEGCTLFMTLLAAFQTLLHRYSGQHDFGVGTPIANRTRGDLEPLIGMFVNTLVLRADLQGDPTFKQLLARVRESTLDAYAHQHLPFERLPDGLRVERDLGRTPLFQVMFILQNAPLSAVSLPGLRTTVVPLEPGTAKFELTLEATPAPDGSLRLSWEYNTALFDAETIRRMSGHFTELLAGIVARPETRVSRLGLVTDVERRLIEAFNPPRSTHAPEVCLHQWFEAVAARTPGVPAVTCDGESLTYAALNERANQLAHLLRSRGVGRETRVAICLDRSIDLVVALVAVLKAGAAYIPLDPAYPAERLAHMISDTRPTVVIAQAAHLPHIGDIASTIVLVDQDEHRAEIEAQSRHNPPGVNQPGDLAYVLYTSGSTGRPKGSLVTHANVVRLFEQTARWFEFGASDVWTLFHSYAFDFSVWEMWGALLYGGRLVVVPYPISRSPEEFLRLVSGEGVTVLNQTPSTFRQFMDADARIGLPLTLRLVIFSGEALPPASLLPWLERHGDERPRLINMYGITETTVHVAYRPIRLRDLADGARSVIGEPIADLTLHVLDAHLQPQPIGVPGEVFVGGAGLSCGYYNRPGLTATRFLPDPFSSVAGARLYRTGDRGRRLPDGDVEYLGRVDDQVKIRGFRVELGEIEATIARHPDVREVAVIVREDGSGKQLVAYLIPRREAPRPEDAIRAWLTTQLPDYMVPRLVAIDAFPITPTGKVDRALLRQKTLTRGAEAHEMVSPRNADEALLAGIWSEVLGVKEVGVLDNFFQLGGHSLLVTLVVSRIRERFGVDLPIRAVFDSPTVAGLTARIAAAQRPGTPQRPSLVALQPAGTRPPFFCVHPIGGTVSCYAELARVLGQERPFYALESPALYEAELSARSMEAMADEYLALIRAVVPHGPYLLGGWSFGGIMASELARKLEAAGEVVALVALIDSSVPGGMPGLETEPALRFLGFAGDLLVGLTGDADWSLLTSLIDPQLPEERRFDALFHHLHDRGLLPASGGKDVLRRHYQVFFRNFEALATYRLPAIAARRVLFRATEQPGADQNLRAWRDTPGALTVIDLAGDHYSILASSRIDALAVQLRQVLDTTLHEVPR